MGPQEQAEAPRDQAIENICCDIPIKRLRLFVVSDESSPFYYSFECVKFPIKLVASL